MKILLIALLVLGLCFPVFAATVNQGGFAFTPVGHTDTNSNDANTETTETDTVVWAPASGRKIVLMGLAFTSAVATTLQIETGTTVIGPLAEVTASGLFVVTSSTPIWQGDEDATLTYTVGSPGRHSIMFWGYETD